MQLLGSDATKIDMPVRQIFASIPLGLANAQAKLRALTTYPRRAVSISLLLGSYCSSF
jgi:hypothetical protein